MNPRRQDIAAMLLDRVGDARLRIGPDSAL